MRVARYAGEGKVAIEEAPAVTCPVGGLLVQTEACGLCSGELMAWYMDQKIPHVLGHEVSARVTESQDERFAVGSRVFAHHHAPCMRCDLCQAELYVHCAQWRKTKLNPGGMADQFAVSAENLTDTWVVDDLRPQEAALIEPLACVMKAVRGLSNHKSAVVGLGFMGLLHMLTLCENTVGYDLSAKRREWALLKGLDARSADQAEPANTVYVCPGSQAAFDFAMSIVTPGGTILMFAPLPPGEDLRVPQRAYFQDITIRNAYSCGPNDTIEAIELLRSGRISAEQVVSHFVTLEALPEFYQQMKSGEILKPMVIWDTF